MMPLALADMGSENIIRPLAAARRCASTWRIWALWPAARQPWCPPWAATSL